MKHASQSHQAERSGEPPLAHTRGYGEPPPRWKIRAAGAVLVLAALAAYANSFHGPFVFDDLPSVLENPSIRTLWPPSVPLSPPRGFGLTVSGRPLLNLSLAINYAISGTNPWSYHVLNLVIHSLGGLALFGLVRRTLLQPMISPRLREAALPVAFVTALLWLVHPLQTEAVTYVIQRAESLMALFFLLTLYAFSRGTGAEHDATNGHPRSRALWRWLAALACLAGVFCKEVMVVVPVVVLVYDRTFVAESFRRAWLERRTFYVALLLTWVPLGWLVASTGGDRGGTFALTWAAAGNYWLGQFEAVTRYVQLCFWPAPLIFEYGLFHVHGWSDIAPYAVVVLALLMATAWGLWRRRAVGFLGAAFFLILSPTSVLPGITQMIVEHRMYLPLAAVIVATVSAVALAAGRRGLVVLVVLALAAAGATSRRNQDYTSDLALWSDSVRKRPQSATGQSNLGTAYFKRGDYPQALAHYRASLGLDPESAQTHYNLGLTLEKLGKPDEAVAPYREAIRILPYFAQAQSSLGSALIRQHKYAEALEHLRIALSYSPQLTEAHLAMGIAFEKLDQLDQAAGSYQNALYIDPTLVEARGNLGAVLFKLGKLEEARAELERVLGQAPDFAGAHYHLGLVLAATGHGEEARQQYADAVRLDPTHAEARLNLGIAYAQAGRLADAQRELEETVRRRPEMAEAHANLANVLVELGRLNDAVASYTEALRLRPGYALAHYNLGNALLQLRRWSEARAHFAEAVRLDPGMSAARAELERLDALP